MKKETTLSLIYEHFKTFFLSGLFALFPLTVTIGAITFLYKVSVKWLAPLRSIEPAFLQNIPGGELILILLLTFITGVLVKYFIVGPIIHYIEHLISKIPFINSIHSALKALINFFNFSEDELASRQVVLVNFPNKDFYNIAFILGSAQSYDRLIPESHPMKNESLFRVFLPTSPIPGHGFFIILPKSELIPTTLTFEEAIKIIVSCGIITPPAFPLQ